jgi:hypothetical protein
MEKERKMIRKKKRKGRGKGLGGGKEEDWKEE